MQGLVMNGRWHSRQPLINHKLRLSSQTIPKIVASKACTHIFYSFWNGKFLTTIFDLQTIRTSRGWDEHVEMAVPYPVGDVKAVSSGLLHPHCVGSSSRCRGEWKTVANQLSTNLCSSLKEF